MKNKLLLGIFILPFSILGHSQELPYSVSYQDNGAVIRHATCKLNIYHLDWDEKYLNPEFKEFLSLKGYRPVERLQFSRYNKSSSDPVQEGELSLAMATFHNGRKVHHAGVLGFVGVDRDLFKSESMKEFKAFESNVFKMSPNRDKDLLDRLFVGANGQYQPTNKKPFTLTTNKGRKALTEVYEALPDCISLDSGHHYEEEKYNKNIVISEMNACLNLYNQGKRNIQKYKNSAWPMVTGYSSYATLLAGSFFLNPIALTAGGGFLGFSLIKTTSQNSLKKQLNDSIALMNNTKDCYIKTVEGQTCVDSNPYSLNSLTSGLRKKTAKKIEKYLEHMSSEDFTQRFADYLGTERPCSLTAKKVRKATINKILKQVEKTL